MHRGTRRRRGHGVTSIVILGTLLTSSAHAAVTLPPTGKRALLAWLRAGLYANAFIPEPAPHPSASAHRLIPRRVPTARTSARGTARSWSKIFARDAAHSAQAQQ